MESLKLIENFESIIDPLGQYEIEKHCDHGWATEVDQFNLLFEEMAKASSLLHQDGEEAIQVLEEKLAKITKELEEASSNEKNTEKLIKTVDADCDRLKAIIQQQDEEKNQLKEEAMSSFLAFKDNNSALYEQKKLLYLITRLTWDEKALKKNLIKGYVSDINSKDVSVFETDGKKIKSKTTISDLLWDYISSGTAWK